MGIGYFNLEYPGHRKKRMIVTVHRTILLFLVPDTGPRQQGKLQRYGVWFPVDHSFKLPRNSRKSMVVGIVANRCWGYYYRVLAGMGHNMWWVVKFGLFNQ